MTDYLFDIFKRELEAREEAGGSIGSKGQRVGNCHEEFFCSFFRIHGNLPKAV